MKIELVKSPSLSGKYATIYDVWIDDNTSLFDRFLAEYFPTHKSEILSIVDKIQTIAQKTGARANFFKENEGTLGDGVCAMFDVPKYKLRLFCIRYGTEIIILGGGGVKEVRAWQDDPKLSSEASLIIKIAKHINQAIKDKDIEYSDDYMKLEGDLLFDID